VRLRPDRLPQRVYGCTGSTSARGCWAREQFSANSLREHLEDALYCTYQPVQACLGRRMRANPSMCWCRLWPLLFLRPFRLLCWCPVPALLIILEWWGPQCGSRSAVASNTRTCESAVHTDGHSLTVPVDARRLVCGIDFDAGCAETSASTPYDGADDRCSLQRRNFENSISDRGPRKSQ
jgi:hypothetical protein